MAYSVRPPLLFSTTALEPVARPASVLASREAEPAGDRVPDWLCSESVLAARAPARQTVQGVSVLPGTAWTLPTAFKAQTSGGFSWQGSTAESTGAWRKRMLSRETASMNGDEWLVGDAEQEQRCI